jgi:hypothetical protein
LFYPPYIIQTPYLLFFHLHYCLFCSVPSHHHNINVHSNQLTRSTRVCSPKSKYEIIGTFSQTLLRMFCCPTDIITKTVIFNLT